MSSTDPTIQVSPPLPESPPAGKLTRRRFLKVLGLGAAAAVGGGGYCFGIEPHWVEVVRRDLPIENLPASLAGKTIAQISDLHVGPVVDEAYIRSAVQRAAELKPDIAVITGDLMTCRDAELIERAADVAALVGAPPLGAFCVLGNHDYGLGWANGAVADALVMRLANKGIRTLRNELVNVDGLQLIGLDDMWAHRTRVRRAMERLDPRAASLALAHNPEIVDQPGWGEWRGWIISGHTHGGQVNFPLIGRRRLPVSKRKFTAGEVDAGNGRTVYINRGLGYLMRIRFRCRPEITLFTLTAGRDSA